MAGGQSVVTSTKFSVYLIALAGSAGTRRTAVRPVRMARFLITAVPVLPGVRTTTCNRSGNNQTVRKSRSLHPQRQVCALF